MEVAHVAVAREDLVVELGVVDSVVGDATAAVAIAVDGVEHAVVAADVGSVVVAVDGEDVGEDAETNLVADDVEVVVHPTAAAFAWLLRADDVALPLVVLPCVCVAPLAVVGVAKLLVALHIYDVDLRLVELVVLPFDVDVLLLPLDDGVPLLHAFCAHLQQHVDESPLRAVSNALLPQLCGELRLLPPVDVSFLLAWQLHLPVWYREQRMERWEEALILVAQSRYRVFALLQLPVPTLLFPYQPY